MDRIYIFILIKITIVLWNPNVLKITKFFWYVSINSASQMRFYAIVITNVSAKIHINNAKKLVLMPSQIN